MRKLPEEYEEIYKQFYIDYSNANNFFRKISLIVEKWYHLKAAKSKVKGNSILEIGAGNLNHVRYEKGNKNYDVIEPKNFLIESSDIKYQKKINNFYSSIDEVPRKKFYKKIIAIAVLEHIDNLDLFLEKVEKKLHPEGRFIVEISAEGEFLFWLAWRLTTGIGFWLKYNLDYGLIMRFEHINSAKKIVRLLKKHFKIFSMESFPLSIKHLRLYIHIVLGKK